MHFSSAKILKTYHCLKNYITHFYFNDYRNCYFCFRNSRFIFIYRSSFLDKIVRGCIQNVMKQKTLANENQLVQFSKDHYLAVSFL